MYLDSDTSGKFQEHIDSMLVHYNWLSQTCARSIPARILWNIVPKFHHLWHMGQESVWMNPRYSWTYNSEDWVGRLSSIGLSCRHAVTAAKRGKLVATAYILGQCLSMTFGFQAEGMICLLSPFLTPPVCYLHTIVSGHYQICDLLSASSTVLPPGWNFPGKPNVSVLGLLKFPD